MYMKAFVTMKNPTPQTRPRNNVIPIRGCKNLRDLGGLTNMHGQTVRSGLIFRSGHLHNITDQEAAFLRDQLHLREIIDLRTPDEISEKPDRIIPNITYEELPIVPKALIGITRESGTDVFSIIRKQKKTGQNLINDIAKKIPDITALYASFFNDRFCQEQIRNVINTIFLRLNKDQSGSLLFHCTIGKDRCGVVSMLLLALLGVSRENIIADYLASNKVYKHKARKYYYAVLIMLHSKHMAVTIRDIQLAKKEYITAALDSLLKLAEEHGGISSKKAEECTAWYLTHELGIPAAEVSRFRNIMLV